MAATRHSLSTFPALKDPTVAQAEIIAHFEDCVRLTVSEKRLTLVELFGYRYNTHSAAVGAVHVSSGGQTYLSSVPAL